MPKSALTDFRCYLPGRLPEGWSPAFGLTSAPYKAESTDPDPPEAARIVCAPLSSSVSGIVWDVTDEFPGDGLHENQESVVAVRLFDGGLQSLSQLRVSGSAGAENCYYARIDGTNGALNVGIRKKIAGVDSGLGRTTLTVGLGWFWLRLRVSGASGAVTANLRLWPMGSAEPALWDLSLPDTVSTVPDGKIGLLSTAAIGYAVGVFGWAVDGGTAPGAESIPASLAEVLANPSAALAWSLRLEYYDLATEEERVQWVCGRSFQGYGTNHRDYPQTTPFLPIFESVSFPADGMEEDGLFSGRTSRSAPQIECYNFDGFFSPRGKVFQGRRATLYLGAADVAHVWHAPVFTAIMGAEPQLQIQSSLASIQLEIEEADNAIRPRKARGRFPNLNRQLDVGRLVGIPQTLLGGIITIPAAARYQVSDFTVFHRFLIDNAPASTSRLSGIETSSTARQWRVDIGTDGRLTLTASVSGVAGAVTLTTAGSVVGGWGWYAVVLDPMHMEALLITEDEELRQSLGAASAAPLANFMAGYGAGHYQLDLRFYAAALSCEQVRAVASQRDDANPAIVGLWRMDDGPGSAVVTDYAPTPNNGAIAGVENVNYFWVQSDLGEPQSAGKLMDVTEGLVFNAPAGLRGSAPHLRYGFSDGPAPLDPGSGNPEWVVSVVKAQGAPLATPADYSLPTTPAGGTIELVSGGSSEPITVDTGNGVAVYPGTLIGGLLAGIGERRGNIDPDLDTDREMWSGLRSLYPWQAGIHWAGTAPALSDVWAEGLAGIGAHLRSDRAGRAVPGALLPPINPGPYGFGSFLEFSGAPREGLVFPELPTLAGLNALHAVTIVLWVKVHNWQADPAAASDAIPCFQEFVSTVAPDGSTGIVCGVSSATEGAILFGCPGITNQIGPGIGLAHSSTRPCSIRSGEWWLIACKLTASNGLPAPTGNYQRSIYGSPLGGSSVPLLWSDTVHGTRTAGTQVRIGRGLAGSVAYVAIYDDDLLPADFLAMLAAPPTQTNALFWARLGEGVGSLECADAVSGDASGVISGARWCPALQIDADATTAGRVVSVRPARPLWQTETEYRRNYAPMNEADIAGAVTDRAERYLLREASSIETVTRRNVRSVYLRARDAGWDTPLLDADSARRVGELYAQRGAPGALVAEVEIDERIHVLRLTDEILVRSTAAGFADWTAWRVVTRSPSGIGSDGQADALAGSVVLWGGFEE